MNKQKIGAVLVGAAILGSATLGAATALGANVAASGATNRFSQGYSYGYGAPAGTAASVAPAAPGTATAHEAVTITIEPGDLTAEEIVDLQFMSEEEKLAHDVYTYIYETYGLRQFGNISKSEQRHTDAIGSLLDAAGAVDYTDGAAIGEFTNPDLQALYDQLVEQASGSVADAYAVGVTIEEVDIADLQERMAATDDASILQVYQNLLNGSYNHLRAFSR